MTFQGFDKIYGVFMSTKTFILSTTTGFTENYLALGGLDHKGWATSPTSHIQVERKQSTCTGLPETGSTGLLKLYYSQMLIKSSVLISLIYNAKPFMAQLLLKYLAEAS